MATDRKLRVFISSTSDLKEERASILVPGAMEAYRYEDDRQRRRPIAKGDEAVPLLSPEQRLEEVLESSEAFVGILGGRYGSVYPGSEGGSIVEWEFKTAIKQQAIEIFPFRKTGLAPEDIDPAQQAFLDSIQDFQGGLWVKPFDTTEQLRESVLLGLADWLSEFMLRSLEDREADAKQKAVSGWKALLLRLVVSAAFSVLMVFMLHLVGWSIGVLIAVSILFGILIFAVMSIGEF